MKYLSAFTIIIIILFFTGCSKQNEIKINASGLKYVDEKPGEGREAKQDNVVTINYRAWMANDSTDIFSDWTSDTTKFAYLVGDSYSKGKAIKFVLGENLFIKGLDEGILGMKTGGIRAVFIPSKLAYGRKGMYPILANSDLKVVVELLEVKNKIITKMWDIDPSNLKATENGLKYGIVNEGQGSYPSNGNAVMINYTGYLQDSTKFYSSVEIDEPFEFVVGGKQVIDGLNEGVRLLKKGGKARLILPPSLAYKNISLPQIPANSTLIFDLELLDIK